MNTEIKYIPSVVIIHNMSQTYKLYIVHEQVVRKKRYANDENFLLVFKFSHQSW